MSDKETVSIPCKFIMLVLLVVAYPLASIWALNVIFGLGIEFNYKTWAAFTILWNALTLSHMAAR